VDLDADARMMMRSFIDALPAEWTDITVTRKNGIVVDSSWIGIRSSGGTRLGIGIDVTDRTRRAKALESARDEAQKMNSLKTAFLANMSHEIRTPLTSILGFSEAIRASLEQPEVSAEALADAVDFVVQIESGGRRLLNTLNAVLDLSRLESGSMSLHITPVSIGPLMRSVIVSLDADMEVEVNASAVQVNTDEMALRTVLSHVIGNAVKFTPPGGTVRCEAERMESAIEIRVEDTGIGISEDFLPRIFQPFVQESSGLGRSHEGNGLGLAVTYHLLELMDGTIDVRSEKGRGTCVTIRLPALATQ
jgi:signal transduction histidine kinase